MMIIINIIIIIIIIVIIIDPSTGEVLARALGTPPWALVAAPVAGPLEESGQC